MLSFTRGQVATGLEFAAMRRCLLPLLVLLAALGAVPGAQDVKGAVVIVGATLVNPTSAVVPNSIITIGGGRIVSVVPLAPGTAATGSLAGEIIDGRGKFVIPGLADMHNHLGAGGMSLGPQRENYVGNLGRLLAVGVTTVFNPDGGVSEFTQLKTAAAADAAPVARFFGTGPAITVAGASLGQQGLTPATAADARAVIQKLKSANVEQSRFTATISRGPRRARSS